MPRYRAGGNLIVTELDPVVDDTDLLAVGHLLVEVLGVARTVASDPVGIAVTIGLYITEQGNGGLIPQDTQINGVLRKQILNGAWQI